MGKNPLTHWRHNDVIRDQIFLILPRKQRSKSLKLPLTNLGIGILVDARLNVDQVAYLKSQKNKINWAATRTVFTWNQKASDPCQYSDNVF